MPFIRGRYHVNPIMGEALEAAREAEAAMLALERGSRDGHDGANHANDQADGFASPHPGEHATDRAASAPIHRVEIEAAEQEGPPWPREGTHGRSVEPGRKGKRHEFSGEENCDWAVGGGVRLRDGRIRPGAFVGRKSLPRARGV